MRFIKNSLALSLFLWLLPIIGNAQIYQPEGINLPGSWNGFTNTNDPLTMGNFRANYRSLGGGQYKTTINIQASGGDAVAGNYTMLFTSGPDANTFANKWAGAAILADDFTDLTYNTGADNTITVADGFYYTFIFKDNGYGNSTTSVLKTSAEPVTIASVSGVPTESVAENTPVSISVELSDVKSPEEKVFIRYSNDGFTTSDAVEVTSFTDKMGTANIPGQAINAKVDFYVLTTTLAKADWDGNIDLATLDYQNNEGINYSYYYETNIEPANRATAVSLSPDFSWFSTDGVTNYDFQLSNVEDFGTTLADEQNLIDTTYTYSSTLSINTKYYWRFKASSETLWSEVYSFTTETEITFANIQFPTNTVINEGEKVTIYGQVTAPGVTDKVGENNDLKAWVAVHSEDTNPATWDEGVWKLATFNVDKPSTDEYLAEIGSSLSIGKYYYAYRYQHKAQSFVYGGINGLWNGTTNTSGQLEVLEIPALISPSNNATKFELSGTLSWESIDTRVQGFQVQIDDEPTLGSPIVDDSEISASLKSYNIAEGVLQHATKYFWKVRTVYDTTSGGWSETFAFTTKQDVPEKVTQIQPESDAENIPLAPTFTWKNALRADIYTIEVSDNQNFGTTIIQQAAISDTQYVVANSELLKSAGTYFWRVKAENESGYGNWSDTLGFKTKISTPNLETPTEDATDIATSAILTWNRIYGALTYDVQLSEISSFSTTVVDSVALSDTLFVTPELENSTSYYWRVRANYANDTSAWSSSRLFTTENPAPLPPVLLTPANNSQDLSLTPELGWSEVVDAESYDLQLSLKDDFSADVLIDSSGIMSTEITTNSLQANTNYYWRVRSVNTVTGTGNWSAVFSFMTIPTEPSAFEGISPTNGESEIQNPVTFVWEKSDRAEVYQFQYSEDDNFVFVSDTITSDTSLTISSFEAGSTYFWRVRAKNNGGNSQWTSTLEFSTKGMGITGPELLAPLNDSFISANDVEFEWEAVANAVSYAIQISESSSFSEMIVDSTEIESPQITFTGLEQNKLFYWRVKAAMASDESDWSQIFMFTTQTQEQRIPALILPTNKEEGVAVPTQFLWNEVEGAESYEIKISKKSDFSISIDSSGIADTTFVLNTMDAGTKYFWKVRSINHTGKSNWGDVFNFTTAVELPGAPELLNPEDSELISLPVHLGWNNVARAETYHVQVATDVAFEMMEVDSANITAVTFTLRDLEENRTYLWRVRAENAAGFGEWSQVASFTTQISTEIENEELPSSFELKQNYPNPFNPSTTISFSIAEPSFVSINVYNVTGQKVADLVNGRKSVGNHQIVWDASNAASGVYYYQMIADGKVFTQRMTLIK